MLRIDELRNRHELLEGKVSQIDTNTLTQLETFNKVGQGQDSRIRRIEESIVNLNVNQKLKKSKKLLAFENRLRDCEAVTSKQALIQERMDVIVELVRQVQTSSTSDLDTNYRELLERLVPLEEGMSQLIANDQHMRKNDKHFGAMNFLARIEHADQEGKKWERGKSPLQLRSTPKMEGKAVPSFLTDPQGARRRRNSTLMATEDTPAFLDPYVPASHPSE